MSMRPLISRFIFSSLFLSFSPVLASNYYNQADCELQREYQGWMDATCSYYVDGWVAEGHARDVLRRVNLAFIGQMVILRDQALKKIIDLKTRRLGCDMTLGTIQFGLSFQFNE